MNARRVAKVKPSVDFPLFYLILQTSIELGSYFETKAFVRLMRLLCYDICISFIKHNLK